MNRYFSVNCPEGPFVLFSMPHNIAIIIILSVNVLLYLFSDSFKNNMLSKGLRICLAFILILQEISFQIWNVSIGEWTIGSTLPLQLCGISAILCALMLVNKSYSLYEVIYFWGIGGAAQAILTPEIGIYTFPHYRYFQFFIAHGAIITTCLFMTFVEGYRPRFKSLWKAIIILNIYAAFIALFNKATGANYLFICEKPQISSLMNFLGPWPWYILSLEAVAIIMFLIIYSPFAVSDYYNKIKTKNNFLDFS